MHHYSAFTFLHHLEANSVVFTNMRMEQLCSSAIPSLRFWYWLWWRVCLHRCWTHSSVIQQFKRLFRSITSEKSSTKRSRVFRTERVPFNNNKPIFNLWLFLCARIFSLVIQIPFFIRFFAIFFSFSGKYQQTTAYRIPQMHHSSISIGTKKDEIKWKVTDQSNVGFEFKVFNRTIHLRLYSINHFNHLNMLNIRHSAHAFEHRNIYQVSESFTEINGAEIDENYSYEFSTPAKCITVERISFQCDFISIFAISIFVQNWLAMQTKREVNIWTGTLNRN